MKKILLLLPLLLILFTAQAQSFQECDSISFDTEEDINAAEPCILELSNYVISQPVDSKGDIYEASASVIIQWMMKTPNYTFMLFPPMDIMKGKNKKLLNVYMACLAKAGLKKGGDGAEKSGMRMFVKYIKNSNNNVKMTKGVKKFLATQD